MSSFAPSFTNKGLALQAKAQTGTPLQFTRVAVGDGSLGSHTVANLTALISQKKSLPITKLKTQSGGKATIGFVFSNTGLTTGFYFREIGLFAQDPTEGEILYCYGNAGSGAEFIQPESGSEAIEKAIDIIALVGNAATVTAAIDSSLVFPTKADFDNHVNSYVRHPGYAAASGAANTYTITLDPTPTSYVEGMAVSVKINVQNTGASTLNVNGIGAKTIKKANGNDVASGNLKAGSIYTLRYNGTNFILQGEGGSGTAQPSQVLSGTTFTNDDGDQTGTMTNNGAVAITPGTSNKAIAAGYHNGSGYVVGDVDLVPGNIKSGVDIFGVVGTVLQAQGNAGAAQVLEGYTASNAGSAGFAGSMPNRGAPTITPSTSDQGLSAGYYLGGTIKGDPNLVAGNIKSGINLFGITGTGPSLKMAKMTATGPASWSDYIVDLNFTGMTFTPEFAAIYYDGPIYKGGAFPGVTVPLLATTDTTTYISGGANDLYATNVQNGTQVALYAGLLNVSYGSCTVRITAGTTVTGITGSGKFTILFFGK